MQPGLVGLDPGSQPGGGLTTPLALGWRRCVWWAGVLRMVVHCFPWAHYRCSRVVPGEKVPVWGEGSQISIFWL